MLSFNEMNDVFLLLILMVPLVQSSISYSLIIIDNKHSFTARGVIIKPETKRLHYRSGWDISMVAFLFLIVSSVII